MSSVSTPAVTTTATVQFLGQDVQVASADGTVGFYGTAPVAKQTVAADGTDAGTTLALANSLKAALVALGLVSE